MEFITHKILSEKKLEKINNRDKRMILRTVLGDITKIGCDAIVNAANTTLLGGGGVDGAIHRAAGKELLEECKTLNGCKTGEAKITKGYKLPAKYIIHTPGPIWHGGSQDEENLLKSCYVNCLALAVEHEFKTVAFPSISTGVYRFPLEKASVISINAIRDFCKVHNEIEEVIIVCFDKNTKEYYDDVLNN